MINLIALLLPIGIAVFVGFYLYMRYSIAKSLEAKNLTEAVKEVLDVKKDTETRRNDSIDVVNEQLSEFTRKE
jgi:hypothetical protein